MPENARISNFNWSPDYSKMAFTHTTENGVEVWVLDMASANAKRIMGATANANRGNPIRWFKDGKSLLVKCMPAQREQLINTDEAVPAGPTVSVSSGEKAQNRTYQDLLKNNIDEHNFEQLVYAELYKLDINGNKSKWKEKGNVFRYCIFSRWKLCNGDYDTPAIFIYRTILSFSAKNSSVYQLTETW